MKCKNCGNELMDGAVFCQACGTKQDEPAEVKQEETKAEEAKAAAEAPKAEEKPAEEKKEESAAQAQAQPEAQPQVQAQPQASAQPQAGEGKKKPILPIILGIAAAVVVIALIALGIKLIGGSKGGSSTAVAYVSKGTLCVITDAASKEPKIYEVCDIDIDDDAYYPYNFITWSDDHKTIYFFDDVDADKYGDLCSVQISKLGKDKAKNESRVVVIDDNVYIPNFTVLSNGKLLYTTSKEKLCFYGGKEPEEIAKDVTSYYLTDDDKGVFYLGDYETGEGYTLSYISITGENATELDDKVSYVTTVEDNYIIYTKSNYDEDYVYTQSLYTADVDGNVDEITDSLGSVGSVTANGFYYTEAVASTVTVYDYIDDPYASSDAAAVEPVYPDSDAGFVQADPEEVFDDYKLARIVKKFDGDPVAYMESNCSTYTYGGRDYYYTYNSDTYEAYYYDIAGDVYYRYDSDKMAEARDKYYEDQEVWYDIQNRIYLRESLKEYEVDPGYVALYYYHDGQSEEIVEECKDVKFAYIGLDTPMAFYHAANSDDIEKLSIDDISYAYDAYDRLFGYSASDDYGDIFYAIGKDADLSLGESGKIGSIGGTSTDSRVALEIVDEDKTEIFLYNLKGTTLEQDSKFDDEAELIAGYRDGKVYFIKNISEYGETGDVFVYDGKDNSKVIKNVNLYDSGIIFENGNMIFTDDKGKAVLYNAAGEEIVKLGNLDSVWDVRYFSDKKILFVADEKLCFYNGKETFKIATRVEYIRYASASDGFGLSTYSYYVD